MPLGDRLFICRHFCNLRVVGSKDVLGGPMNSANRKAHLLLATLAVVLGASPVDISSAAEPSPAPPSQPGPRISAHLAAVLKRANDAIRSKNYDLALKELDAADAMQPKSPYDQRIIDELRTYANAQLLKKPQ